MSRKASWSIRILGKGSFGSVQLCENGSTGQKIAIKSVQEDLPDIKKGWKKVVRTMRDGKLKHPNLVGIISLPQELKHTLGSLRENDLPLNTFLGMEYCAGGSLEGLLKRPENLRGLPEKRIRSFLGHIGDAVSYLHEKGIIHRDIKPSNILLASDYSQEIIFKLGDVGLDQKAPARTPGLTYGYLAPEILIEQKYDKFADYWSFGVVTYQVACGRLPSPGTRGLFDVHVEIQGGSHLTPLFSRQITSWLRSMLQLSPSKRGQLSDDMSSHEHEFNCDALCALKDLLNRKYLEIHTISGLLLYEIDTQTKISEIQQFLQRDIGLESKDQMLLTQAGSVVQPCVLAMKYLTPLKSRPTLYLLPRTWRPLDVAIRISQLSSTFLRSEELLGKDPVKAGFIWRSGINDIQLHLQRTTTFWNMSLALGKCRSKLTDSSTQSTFLTSELKELQRQVQEISTKALTLIEMEEQLQALEKEDPSNKNSLVSIKATATSLIGDSENCFEGTDGSRTGQATISRLNQLYEAALKEYVTWEENGFSAKSLEKFKMFISQFLLEEQAFLIDLNSLLRSQHNFLSDDEKRQKLQSALDELKSLMELLVSRRLATQEELVKVD